MRRAVFGAWVALAGCSVVVEFNPRDASRDLAVNDGTDALVAVEDATVDAEADVVRADVPRDVSDGGVVCEGTYTLPTSTRCAMLTNVVGASVQGILSESCGSVGPPLATGRLVREANVTGAALGELLSAALSGGAVTVQVHARSAATRRMGATGTLRPHLRWSGACATRGCSLTTEPTTGDYVEAIVTLRDGTTARRYYGDLSDARTCTLPAVTLGNAVEQDYDLDATVTLDADALLQGLTRDPAAVRALVLRVSLGYTLEAECTGGAIGGEFQARLDFNPVITPYNRVCW